MDTNTLQVALENRALSRLNKDLNDLEQMVSANRFLSKTPMKDVSLAVPNKKLIVEGKDEWIKKSIEYAIRTNDTISSLRKYWLPIYIKEETEKFLADVDNLKASVDDLYNNIEH